MKILHICTGWPISLRGGITNYVRCIADEQCRQHNEVYVLGAPDTELHTFNYIPYTSEKIKPFTYSPLVDKKGLRKIEQLLEKNRFDIIHIHALEYVDWDIYDIVKKYKYVVSLHDYCFICPRIYMYRPNHTVCDHYDEDRCKRCVSYLDRLTFFCRVIRKFNYIFKTEHQVPHLPQHITEIRYQKFINLLNHADAVLPVSYKVDEIYRNSGMTAPSYVLHIGNVSADTYSQEFVYDRNPHAINIVFLGRLSEYKGADLFIRIASHYKNSPRLRFHFLGRSSGYEHQLGEAGIVDHGAYDPSQLSVILQNYDLGMVLSIWHDNGPQVVMELINNHVPVIGTKMGGIPDFIEHRKTGYIFDPYSEEEINELYDFLDHVSVGDIYKMKMAIRPTTTTKEHYGELMDIYNRVLSNG